MSYGTEVEPEPETEKIQNRIYKGVATVRPAHPCKMDRSRWRAPFRHYLHMKGIIYLLFDFGRFSKIAASVYNDNNLYSLEDCLHVFRCYFEKYEEFTGRVHPPIRASQISRIMQDMPYIDEAPSPMPTKDWTPIQDLEPDFYPLLIQLHFKTKYRNCDYNINHFFSGRIRDLRTCEAYKGYE